MPSYSNIIYYWRGKPYHIHDIISRYVDITGDQPVTVVWRMGFNGKPYKNTMQTVYTRRRRYFGGNENMSPRNN